MTCIAFFVGQVVEGFAEVHSWRNTDSTSTPVHVSARIPVMQSRMSPSHCHPLPTVTSRTLICLLPVFLKDTLSTPASDLPLAVCWAFSSTTVSSAIATSTSMVHRQAHSHQVRFASDTRECIIYMSTFTHLAQLDNIRHSSTLARILCRTAYNLGQIQPKPFYLPSGYNKLTNCIQFADINYQLWKER